jgi:hypothetical protein
LRDPPVAFMHKGDPSMPPNSIVIIAAVLIFPSLGFGQTLKPPVRSPTVPAVNRTVSRGNRCD